MVTPTDLGWKGNVRGNPGALLAGLSDRVRYSSLAGRPAAPQGPGRGRSPGVQACLFPDFYSEVHEPTGLRKQDYYVEVCETAWSLLDYALAENWSLDNLWDNSSVWEALEGNPWLDLPNHTAVLHFSENDDTGLAFDVDEDPEVVAQYEALGAMEADVCDTLHDLWEHEVCHVYKGLVEAKDQREFLEHKRRAEEWRRTQGPSSSI